MMTRTNAVEPSETMASPSTHRLDDVRVLVLFGGSELFGQERANLEVFRTLSEIGLKARFITSSKWGEKAIQPELSRMGFEWTTAPFGYQWGKFLVGRKFYFLFVNLWGVLATSWRVWREAHRWRPSHLYAMNWVFYTYAAPAIWLLKLPFVFRAGDELPLHTFFHRLITKTLLRRIDLMVCISRHIQQHCVLAGFPAGRTRLIYNYPPKRLRSPVPRKPNIPDGAVVATYVGQVSKRKGVGVLIEAAERMIRGGVNLVLWIVGESSWGDQFMSELKQRQIPPGLIDRIVFFGYVENVFSILESSDIHVCPSLEIEALSNVVLEAKLSGKPSVVFPTGGLPELIEHRQDGYVCQDHTVEALIEGIEYFATDETRRCAAGAAARRSLDEKFGEERFRRDWAEVFVRAINECS